MRKETCLKTQWWYQKFHHLLLERSKQWWESQWLWEDKQFRSRTTNLEWVAFLLDSTWVLHLWFGQVWRTWGWWHLREERRGAPSILALSFASWLDFDLVLSSWCKGLGRRRSLVPLFFGCVEFCLWAPRWGWFSIERHNGLGKAIWATFGQITPLSYVAANAKLTLIQYRTPKMNRCLAQFHFINTLDKSRYAGLGNLWRSERYPAFGWIKKSNASLHSYKTRLCIWNVLPLWQPSKWYRNSWNPTR